MEEVNIQVAQVIGGVAGIVVILSAIFFWSVKWLLDRYHEQMEARFEKLEKTSTEWRTSLQDVERDVLKLRAELPEKYVQREDWIRFGAVLEAKIDALRGMFEQLKEEFYGRRGSTGEGET